MYDVPAELFAKHSVYCSSDKYVTWQTVQEILKLNWNQLPH